MSDELFQETEDIKEIESKQETAVGTWDASSLLWLAVNNNLDTDKLEKLIALKNQEEERLAKKEFDFHFSEMQKEFEPVQRNKKGFEYKYAPIEVLQSQYRDIISRHGFSYRWHEEKIENGKRCVLTISGWGHSESNYFDIPQLETTARMNNVQAAGAMSTYGRRYTFVSGFGIIIEDEDDIDNLSVFDGAKYAEDINRINECESMEDLVKVWACIHKITDDEGRKKLAVIYNAKKSELIGKKK